eukprot:5272507-Pleurochrysis_carterae.AAC.3
MPSGRWNGPEKRTGSPNCRLAPVEVQAVPGVSRAVDRSLGPRRLWLQWSWLQQRPVSKGTWTRRSRLPRLGPHGGYWAPRYCTRREW